jgi:hypothetical protein
LSHRTRIPIGGIKFSDERAHYTIYRPLSEQATINDFLQRITHKQVNISFLCHTLEGVFSRTCFCVSIKDIPSISEIINDSSLNEVDIATQLQVGSITIFPHRNDITLIAVIMSLMESLELPVYSFCTSISALIYNTRFIELENIANHLTDICELPENHSPFHPEFQLRQPRNSIAQ